jgi:hypothetical protein
LGAIDIQPNSLTMSANMDVSDTIEITGSCRDLGRRNNRILVQVFAGDLNESVDPYIDNTTSSKCLNLASGIPVGQNCFAVTKGIGLIEDAGLPDQKDFPQCHNGQFGFSVRLGKILTDPALGVSYLVRFKLRTQDGSLNDTVWSRVTVNRALTPPAINSATVDPLNYRCTLANSLARFNQNIAYTLQRTYTMLNGTQSAPSLIGGFPATSASPLGYLYADSALVDGVDYSYSLVAAEGEYSAFYPGPQTATSNAMICKIPPPVMGAGLNPTAGSCYLTLSQINTVTPGISYDVGYVINTPFWTTTNVTPTIVGCNAGSFNSSPYYCTISGLASGATYNFSVRARGIGGEIGSWAVSTFSCKPP